MPDYRYFCENCGNSFEINCKMSEVKETVKCEKCNQLAKRDISDFGTSSFWKCGGAFGKSE